MSQNKLTEIQLATAKSLYMSHKPISEISEALGVNRTSIQYYVSKEWKEVRELKDMEVLQAFSEARVSKINTIAKHTVDAMILALEALKNRDKPPTMQEAKAAAAMFESIDKIMRLDKGDPTDIIAETKPVTIIELREQFRQIDPFHKEIEDEDSKKDS